MNTVAFVFQDTYIFAESVYDNIAMHQNVTQEAVEMGIRDRTDNDCGNPIS